LNSIISKIKSFSRI